ncbi:MAG TPA: carbohydrate-binding domain-containing protein [Eubacteriales bacterium]|nr:carbohydrate-binding domain-containing protein [Eubacteriales bacterium]
MKKLTAIFIALALTFTLTACQNIDNIINGNDSDQSGENGVSVAVSVEITEDDLNEDISSYTEIIFSQSGVTAQNCTVSGTVVTITKSGTYLVSGSCSDGQILVNAKDCEVKIALNGLTLSCGSSAPIFIQKAEKVIITLCSNTVNTLTDTANYVLNEDEEPSATIFSKSDLTINGGGILTINANYNNAIQCKDVLKITNGTINVNSVDDGIIGKDFLYIMNAEINAECGGDGLRSTNDSDTKLGTIYIESGIINLICGNDGIQAANGILINGGTFDITTGGGSANSSSQSQQTPWGTWGSSTSNSDSAKAIKATNSVVITSGEFNIDSSDDSVHCNDSMLISGGNFEVSSGDDGFHADNILIISGAVIDIEKSYEGIESVDITISGGEIKIISSDDGINAAGGNDQSSVSGRPGQNPFGDTSNACITISGGTISIIADGDGIDSNGNIVMSNGYIIVEGPTNDGNGALDYQNQFTFSGGTLLALGSSGMAQMPSSNSTKYSVMIGLNSYTLSTIKIANSSNETVIEYTPSKKYSNIVFASDTLIKDSYSIYLNGVIFDEFTISSTTTTVGATSGMGGIGGQPRP